MKKQQHVHQFSVHMSISTIAMYCNHHQHNDILASVDLVRANATWLRIARLDFSYDQILNSPSIVTFPFEQNSLERSVKQIKKKSC